MNDKKLISALMETIENQLTLVDIESFDVCRKFQPSDQFSGGDADSEFNTQIFLQTISNPGRGHGRVYRSNNTKRADQEHMTKVVQVSVLHNFDYADPDSMTPEDMCSTIRALINSPDAIKELRSNLVYLQEVGDPRPVFVINEKDKNESMPNFDVTVNYKTEIVKEVGTVDQVVAEEQPV